MSTQRLRGLVTHMFNRPMNGIRGMAECGAQINYVQEPYDMGDSISIKSYCTPNNALFDRGGRLRNVPLWCHIITCQNRALNAMPQWRSVWAISVKIMNVNHSGVRSGFNCIPNPRNLKCSDVIITCWCSPACPSQHELSTHGRGPMPLPTSSYSATFPCLNKYAPKSIANYPNRALQSLCIH